MTHGNPAQVRFFIIPGILKDTWPAVLLQTEILWGSGLIPVRWSWTLDTQKATVYEDLSPMTVASLR